MSISRVDGLSTDPPVLGRLRLCLLCVGILGRNSFKEERM